MIEPVHVHDLLPAGTVWALTTRTSAGGLRTRPVTVFAGTDLSHAVVLTGARADKVAQLEADPALTLVRQLLSGWIAVEGIGEVERERRTVAEHLRRAGMASPAAQVAVLRIRPTRARRWEVVSERPWDNTCRELVLARDAPHE